MFRESASYRTKEAARASAARSFQVPGATPSTRYRDARLAARQAAVEFSLAAFDRVARGGLRRRKRAKRSDRAPHAAGPLDQERRRELSGHVPDDDRKLTASIFDWS